MVSGKRNSVKILNPEGIGDGIVEYIGRALIEGMDNYHWSVKWNDGEWDVILYREVGNDGTLLCKIESGGTIWHKRVEKWVVMDSKGFYKWILDNTINYDKVKGCT